PARFPLCGVRPTAARGATAGVPPAGPVAPEVSRPLLEPIALDLGLHVFGETRAPSARAAEARWGSGTEEVGLAGSPKLGFTGPSSFDVEPDGTVDLLDSVNGRIQRWSRDRHEVVPLGRSAELADVAAEADGSFDVLDPQDTLRRYRDDGSEQWAQKIAERTWAKLDRGAEVLQEPSEQWLPLAQNGRPLTRAEQRRAGQTAHHALLVDRVGDGELRVAQLRGNGLLRSWRITSDTPLGEVQLAEPHGNNVALATHVYTDDRDEFVVLVLGDRGVVRQFSIGSDSWTETAPLARFRLARGALYRLRTAPVGAVVDPFDLEVPQ